MTNTPSSSNSNKINYTEQIIALNSSMATCIADMKSLSCSIASLSTKISKMDGIPAITEQQKQDIDQIRNDVTSLSSRVNKLEQDKGFIAIKWFNEIFRLILVGVFGYMFSHF